MALRIQIPMTSSSFRNEHTTRPTGYRTPPPPSHEVEPLSPTPLDAGLSASQWPVPQKRKLKDANFQEPTRSQNYSQRYPYQNHSYRSSAPSHIHQPQSRSNAQSPTALDLFAAVATSPELAQGHFSPSAYHKPHQESNEHNISYQNVQSLDNRPSKRSRSEAFNARSLYDSRPATSHVPSADYYSRHQNTSNGPHYDVWGHRHASGFRRRPSSPEEDMQDAELLLGFARGSNIISSRKPVTHAPPLFPHELDRDTSLHHTQSAPEASAKFKTMREAKEEVPTFPGPLATIHDLEGSGALDKLVSHISEAQCPGQSPPHAEQILGHTAKGQMPEGPLAYSSPKSKSEEHKDPARGLDTTPGQDPTAKKSNKGWPKGKPRGKKTGTAEVGFKKKPGRNKKDEQTQVVPLTGVPNQNGPLFPTPNPLSQSHTDLSIPATSTISSQAHEQHRATSEPRTSNPTDSTRDNRRRSSLPLLDPAATHSNNSTVQRDPVTEPKVESAERDVSSNICGICESANIPNGFQVNWIGCNGCKRWFHTACAGLKNEREVRDIDKFYCHTCEANGKVTTHVRKSGRAHASLDYAGLNEGEVRTSTDSVDHHYIQGFKDGSIQFQQEMFPRMRPELVTAEFFERSATMAEPVLIPAEWNPRPQRPGAEGEQTRGPEEAIAGGADDTGESYSSLFDYDCVPDDGQDKMDMVMPHGLTVRAVAELVGPEERVEVIDVKSQEGGDNRWNLRKWAEYYEAEGEKPVRNVISLEVSQTKLGRLIRRPKIVRDLDLQDAVWPQDELAKGTYPQVQFYCLMSVKDCYTDFHIDFGGSSVYYHILKGNKTFFFIPPKKQHLKAYEQWCKSANQGATFLGDVTKECYRVDLSEGDTMLIPSGWIHSVWTPSNSLVIGGNFLTRMHYGMQIAINDVEKATGVGRRFRYPHFQKVLWYAVVQYLQEDPVPSTVVQTLCEGRTFDRRSPTYDDFEPAEAGDPAYCHARYYSRGEIEGLTDLMRYVYRTVMISLGKVQGVSKTTTEAVVRSLPKGYGDHLDLLKTFAMWCAWKRGNETLPQWAFPDFPASDIEPIISDKKPAVVAKKQDVQPERRSSRLPKEKEEKPVGPTPFDNAPKLDNAIRVPPQPSAPKSAPGPRRIACEACRKRRIRCKHKDTEEQPYSSASAQRFGVKPITEQTPQVPAVEPNVDPMLLKPWAPVAVMIPPAGEASPPASSWQTPAQVNSSASKAKACDECRKSKVRDHSVGHINTYSPGEQRRCIHDEYGRVDQFKASQTPVPRAYSATKRNRADEEVDDQTPKKMKIDDSQELAKQALNESAISFDGFDTNTEPDWDAPYVFANAELPVKPQAVADHLLDPSLMQTEVEQTPTFGDSAPMALPEPDETDPEQTHPKDPTTASFDPGATVEYSHQQKPGVPDAAPTLVQDPLPGPSDPVKPNPDQETPKQVQADAEVLPNGPVADSKSRTPSLRVQTNSSESNAATGSVPSSPLTELDPSSPTVPEHEEGQDGGVLAQRQDITTPAYKRARSTRIESMKPTVTTPAPKAHKRTSASRAPSMSATPARTTSSKKSNASSHEQRSISKGTADVGVAASPTAVSPEDEASIKLIRAMQEQEFGLRRRGRGAT